MSNYTKSTNFATKDTLETGNPSKIIKGTEHDTEYNAIASAISSKADTASPTFTGTPAAPTATTGTNTSQLATTAFVQQELEAAGGQIIQTVQSVYTSVSSTGPSTSLVSTGHTATITPSSTSSKIYVSVAFTSISDASYDAGFTITRGSTNLAASNNVFVHYALVYGTPIENCVGLSMQYLDSPNTTSATTYTVNFFNPASPQTLYYNNSQGNGGAYARAVMTLWEIL